MSLTDYINISKVTILPVMLTVILVFILYHAASRTSECAGTHDTMHLVARNCYSY